MKLCDKRISRVLKSGGKIAKPRWGSSEWLRLSDMGDIQHYVVTKEGVYFENYHLNFFNLYEEEWMEVK